MYARLTQGKSDPAQFDALVEQLKSELLPVFEKQPGYLGTIQSVDRATGLGATTTFWDSMENLRASEAAIFAARDQFAAHHGTEIISVHRCEVAVQETQVPPHAGSFAPVTVIAGRDPSKIDESIRRYREDVAPQVLSQPGAEAAVLLIDRENNVGFGISVWDTAEHREATDAMFAARREEAAREAGGQAQVMLAETTYADLKIPVKQ